MHRWGASDGEGWVGSGFNPFLSWGLGFLGGFRVASAETRCFGALPRSSIRLSTKRVSCLSSMFRGLGV